MCTDAIIKIHTNACTYAHTRRNTHTHNKRCWYSQKREKRERKRERDASEKHWNVLFAVETILLLHLLKMQFHLVWCSWFWWSFLCGCHVHLPMNTHDCVAASVFTCTYTLPLTVIYRLYVQIISNAITSLFVGCNCATNEIDWWKDNAPG